MRAIARLFSICGFAALLAVLGSALLAAGAVAQPTGTPPAISPAADSTTTSPQIGDTLTEVPATWSGTPITTNIQWFDCDSSGQNCNPISGASGLPGSTYTVAASDVGSTIEVAETDTDNTGTTTLTSGPTLVVGQPPSNTAPPRVSGTDQQGQTLTETNGTWTNNPTSFSYQWLDCDSSGNNCSDVAANGTAQSYTLTNADTGFTIEAQETASNAGGAGTPANSAPTTIIVPLPPVDQTPPSISGTTQQGQQLTETNGTWTNSPTSFSYQWLRCDSSGNNCAAIHNATHQTYTLTSADVGNTIAVEETASNSGGAGNPADSATTAVITQPPPVNTSPPKISGTAQQGQTLTDTNGTWTNNPTSFSYQWLDCDSSGNNCTSIPGDTGPTYAPTESLLGDTVEVQEIATNSAGSSAPADSAPTAVITLNPSTTDLLAEPGTPVTNQLVTLIATVTSSFAPAPPAGSVSFDDAGTPIGGCSAVAVTTLNQSVEVTCQTTFSAATSPQALTVVFTPDLGAGIAASTSQSLSLPVGQASTSTTLDVSNPTVFVGSTATYTATVATGRGERVQPSGAVRFSDSGAPIASCSGQAHAQSPGSLSARCTVRYLISGRHTITAQYNGDGNFSGSDSPSEAVKVQLRPIRIGGAISSKTYWTDFFTPTYTRFLAMVVHKLRLGTTIVLICRGQGCPFARESLLVTSKPCAPKAGCVTEKAQVVDLFPRLRGHKLRVGTVLTVELTRPDWIGKAYVIAIRSGRRPGDRIQCLAPGSTRPGVGC